MADLGTPSAPPLLEIRPEGQSSEAGCACTGNSRFILGFDEGNEVSNMPKESAQEISGAKDPFLHQNEQCHKFEVKEREDNYGVRPEIHGGMHKLVRHPRSPA